MTSYGTTLQLARFMGIESKVPDLTIVGSDRSQELVGTGDNNETIFWLNHAYVLAESYNLYYGSSENNELPLIETTHYVIDKDMGKITLTPAGVTLVSTNNIYATYSYCNIGITDTQLQDSLNRAVEIIDSFTNNHFVDSSVLTPNWNQHLDEKQDGAGIYDRNYFTLQNYPIPYVSTTTNGAILADDTSITVMSTSGFPDSGYILIEDNKISYTGKTDTTFTGCTSVLAHEDSQTVKAYVVEISTTSPGGTISWNVLKENTEFDMDHNTGRIHIYANGNYYNGNYVDVDNSPPRGIANRFRTSYISGFSSIPNDVIKANLMISANDIMKMVVRKAHTSGLNDFNPSLITVDEDEIKNIIEHYRNEHHGRV